MLTQVSHRNEHLFTPFRALSQTEEEISTSQFHISDLYGLLYLFARTRQLKCLTVLWPLLRQVTKYPDRDPTPPLRV